MKKQRILAIILALVMVMTSVLLVACTNEKGELCSITVIIGEKTYQVKTETRTLHEALQEMLANKVISVYEFSGTQFSPYVTKLDTIADTYSVDQKFITVFHNIDDLSLKMLSSTTYQPFTKVVNGETFYCSAVGVALLPVVDGASYYLFATNEMFF